MGGCYLSSRLDMEWVLLILDAKNAGISLEEIQEFLRKENYDKDLIKLEQQRV